LTELNYALGSAVSDGRNNVSILRYDGNKCEWPYAAVVQFVMADKPPVKVVFLRSLQGRRTESYQFWCERGPGVISLTTSFENIVPKLAVDNDGRILVAFSDPATVFVLSETGAVLGPDLVGGIIAIPAALSVNLLTMAADAEIHPQQAIDLLEADIRTIRQNERK
jgi:hypothetical protein